MTPPSRKPARRGSPASRPASPADRDAARSRRAPQDRQAARPRPASANQSGAARSAAAARATGSRRPTADPARPAAFDVLRAVAERDAYANLLLPSVLRERRLTGRDAALATELAYGTLRGQGTYDAILAVCSDRGLDQIDPPVRQVLRLGAHQLLATRIGAHAAVATSVDLARDVAGQRPAGFVNAVLRKVATRDLDVLDRDRRAQPRQPIRSGTWPSGTATRAGSWPRCATRWARTRRRPGRDRRRAGRGRRPARG